MLLTDALQYELLGTLTTILTVNLQSVLFLDHIAVIWYVLEYYFYK